MSGKGKKMKTKKTYHLTAATWSGSFTSLREAKKAARKNVPVNEAVHFIIVESDGDGQSWFEPIEKYLIVRRGE